MRSIQDYKIAGDTDSKSISALMSPTKYVYSEGGIKAKKLYGSNTSSQWSSAMEHSEVGPLAEDTLSSDFLPEVEAYIRYDNEITVLMPKVISMDRVEGFTLKKIMEEGSMVKDTQSEDPWSREKEELLKTHHGWFVAYQDGERVALEPSLDRLVAALNKELGTPRKPCELHEIVERPPIQRGPSPRLWPTHTGG